MLGGGGREVVGDGEDAQEVVDVDGRRLGVDAAFRVQGLGFRVWGLGFGVWGVGFGVWGLGFRI